MSDESKKEDFTADTFEEFDGRFDINQRTGSLNNDKFFMPNQNYPYFNPRDWRPPNHMYANNTNNQEISQPSNGRKSPYNRDYSNRNPYNHQERQNYFYNQQRNGFPMNNSKNHSTNSSGYQSNFDWKQQPKAQYFRNCSAPNGQKTENGNSNGETKKENKKLKILRHSPLPATAKVSPKKLIEKLTKLDKESLKNIINNPSRYDGILQQIQREQALREEEKSKQLANIKPNDSDQDKGEFNLIPDDTVEIPQELMDLLGMGSGQEAGNGIPALMSLKVERPIDSSNEDSERSDDNCPKANNLMSRIMAAEDVKTSYAKKQTRNTGSESSPDKDQIKIIYENNNNEQHLPSLNKEGGGDKEGNPQSQEKAGRKSKDSDDDIIILSPQEVIKIESDSSTQSISTSRTKKNSTKKPTTTSITTRRQSRVDGSAKGNLFKTPNSKSSPSSLANKKRASIKSPRSSSKVKPKTSGKSSSTSSSSSTSTTSSTSATSSSSSSSTSTSRSSSSSSGTRYRKIAPKPNPNVPPNEKTNEVKRPTTGNLRKHLLLQKRNQIVSERLNIQYVIRKFEEQLLPNLSSHQKCCYVERHSTDEAKIGFICNFCTNRRYTSKRFTPEEIRAIQRGLKSSHDRKNAIDFLMQEITHIINQQLLKEKEAKEAKEPKGKSSTTEQTNVNPVKDIKKQGDEGKNAEPAKGVEAINGKNQSSKKRVPTVGETTSKGKKSKPKVIAKDIKELQQHSSPDTSHDCRQDSNQNETQLNLQNGFVNEISSTNNPMIPFTICDFAKLQQATINAPAITSPIMLSSLPPALQAPAPPPPPPPIPITAPFLNINPASSISVGAAPWVPNLNEIDYRIADLLKRKQFIMEMIDKLNKDNSDLDVQITALMNYAISMRSTMAVTSTSTGISTIPPPSSSTSSSLPSTIIETQSSSSAMLPDTSPDRSMASKRLRLHPDSSSSKSIKASQSDTPINPTIEEARNQSDKENEVTTSNVRHEADSVGVEGSSSGLDSFNYSNVPNGQLANVDSPVNQICIHGESIFGATDSGHLYRFDMTSLQRMEECKKHGSTITQMIFCKKLLLLYTISLDGYLKGTSLKNLKADVRKLNLNDELQSLEVQWDMAFIGTRLGVVHTCNIMNESLKSTVLCIGESSIMCIKATREGPRKILVISSKGNSIVFRDALTGLLLRTIDIAEGLCIYDLMFDESHLYFRTQRQHVLKYDFTTGAGMTSFDCGNAVTTMHLYKAQCLIVGCYDGTIYIFNKNTGQKLHTIQSSDRMHLTFAVFGNKLLTSSKDRIVRVMDIPNLNKME